MGCRVVKLRHQLCLIPHIIFATIKVSLNDRAVYPQKQKTTRT